MEPKKILIVEDETIIGMELKSNLQNLGYTVTAIVNGGEKAMESVRLNPTDIILMDIRLKGKMDGIETAELIRRECEIPIVFLTAYMDEERMDRAKLTMPFGYILKPVQERDLKVTIAMALYMAKIDAERRKAEQELKEKLQATRNIINSIPFGLFIYQYRDPDHLILIDGNPEAQRLTGMEIQKNIGREFNDLWPNAAKTGVTSSYLNALKTGITFETENLFYQGSSLAGTFRILAFSMPGLRLGLAFETITTRKKERLAHQ
jgi:CheY-like chemotaxis protein